MCLLSVAFTIAGSLPALAQRIATTFDADQVDFSFDRRLVTLRGNAHLFSQVVDDPSRFVRIEADLIEGDLSRGRFEMMDGIRIVTPRGAMRGEAASYDARSAEFSLRRAGIMVPLGDPDEDVACGFAYAQEIAGADEIIYITKGRFTTCSRVDPHYSLRADRFRWDADRQEVVVYGGSVQLYGLKIPVLPKIPYSFSGEDTDMPSLWPFPTYTSRAGLRLGWSFAIGDPLQDPATRVTVRWRQLRPLQATSRTTYDISDNLRARLRLGLQEDVRDDIDRIVSVDRFPEVGLEGSWELWGGGYHLETDLSAGHYQQRPEDDLPRVSDERLRLQARLTSNRSGVGRPGETWWWLDAASALYGGGDRYEAVGAGLGGAAELTDWFAAGAEIRQWATGGGTPFVWDDVDLKSELETNLRLRLTDDWRVRLGGRYDLADGELRSWDAQLRRRAHCLTWKVGYSDVSNLFTIGVEINGLFGNDEPAEDACPDEGPPDYWTHHGSADAEAPSEEASVPADEPPRSHID